jgi:SDR family mycofactocin-dependent oxidoreductase
MTESALAGKVALVSGAARGQGRSHALTLAAAGADIIAVDVASAEKVGTYTFAGPEDLAETVRQVEALDRRAVAVSRDVRDRDGLSAEVDAAVDALGRLDIVVANAGLGMIHTWDEVTEEAWDTILGSNLTGVWNTLRAGAKHLVAAGGGAMVATSSTLGAVGRPFFAPYTASKHGVVGLVRSLALELARHSIRVNAVYPTGVDTEMLRSMGGMEGLFDKDPKSAPLFENALPVDLIPVEDVSRAVLYLVSETGRCITGIQLPVDAGFTVR